MKAGGQLGQIEVGDTQSNGTIEIVPALLRGKTWFPRFLHTAARSSTREICPFSFLPAACDEKVLSQVGLSLALGRLLVPLASGLAVMKLKIQDSTKGLVR